MTSLIGFTNFDLSISLESHKKKNVNRSEIIQHDTRSKKKLVLQCFSRRQEEKKTDDGNLSIGASLETQRRSCFDVLWGKLKTSE